MLEEQNNNFNDCFQYWKIKVKLLKRDIFALYLVYHDSRISCLLKMLVIIYHY